MSRFLVVAAVAAIASALLLLPSSCSSHLSVLSVARCDHEWLAVAPAFGASFGSFGWNNNDFGGFGQAQAPPRAHPGNFTGSE